MALSVIRSSRCLVPPSGKTPSGMLDLSIIDKILVLRCNARTLHVFKLGTEPAKVIKQALSKALVPYYPLAGRLKESSQGGELQIECSGEGVWFVEASANCTLEDVNFFDNTESIAYDELLPDQVPEMNGLDPLVLMQVTQFGCGGFVIGLIFCHTICDGLGAAQFLNAIGEIARGYDHPSIAPVWQRDFSTLPPKQANSPLMPNLPLPMPDYKLKPANIDIPLEHINQLKQEFNNSTGQTCSAFEVIAASIWSRRTRAIKFPSTVEVNLVFFANCRQLLEPPLPEGYYGNCFFPVTITAPSSFLAKASISDMIKLIKEAKSTLPNEFAKYLKGEQHAKDENGNENGNGNENENGIDPFAPPLKYTTLFLSEWGRLGFNQVDYGWGPPVHIVPIQGSSIIPVGIVGSLPLPRKGIRLMTWCVEEAHLSSFLEQMNKLI